jgi:uncharacterized protein (TIGR03067 family)
VFGPQISLRKLMLIAGWSLALVSPFLSPERVLAQGGNGEQMFQSLDRNRDGEITMEDAADNNRQMLTHIFDFAGLPEDGRLTRAEFQEVFDAHQSGGGRVPPGGGRRPGTGNDGRATSDTPAESPREDGASAVLMRVCDEDGDGLITRAEWSRLTQRFRTLDENSDDALDITELEALAAEQAETEEPASTSRTSSATRSSGGGNIEGVWRGWVVRGRGENPNAGEMEVELTITNNRIDGRELGTNRGPPGGLGSGTYTLTGTGGSGTLDAVQTAGNDSGRNYIGVYELDGDTLRWCVTGRNRTRPATMATDRGNFLMILTRQ